MKASHRWLLRSVHLLSHVWPLVEAENVFRTFGRYQPTRRRSQSPFRPRRISGVCFKGLEILTFLTQCARSVASTGALDSLLSKHKLGPLLPNILEALASPKSDDTVSNELVDIIGFEHVDIVEKLMNKRVSLTDEVCHVNGSGIRPHHVTVGSSDDPVDVSLSHADARRRIEDTLRQNATRPLYTGVAVSISSAPEDLPHIYTSSTSGGKLLSQFGTKYAQLQGTTRIQNEDYVEVILPAARPIPPRTAERSVLISELDELAKGSFPGYTSLNRMQSIVFPTAYGSNENMLVCAPTGAGKTDVAMLTVLRVLSQNRTIAHHGSRIAPSIDKNSFKIIYVAPMKALASEIVRKLGKRLQWLGIQVRELTGDMQLTRKEISETQIIVTTPEKWDVVTRKPTGEGELASKLKLLIIDEVHLLNDERGAVIETIVARTLRQVESTQSVIRIVGLSATLPNYRDVSDFLCVRPQSGLFFFDSSFRPVPLEQHFLGVPGKPGSPQSRKNLDRAAYLKVSELVEQGHQVMVFVHSRKDTVKTATDMKETATIDDKLDLYSCEDHPQWALFRRSIGESRNKEMKQLFDHGFGIHHAGMLRSDRNLMERMFEARAIKVLCCTATLAWGVNLPAHAVVIKGTQIYDSSKGSFSDLSVLDVLQVFGRAGRPGLETSGEGYICTTIDKLDYYVQAVTSQHPIESQFTSGMTDSLNAEISLGTVANADEAVRWLGYTYMLVRMKKNPLQYGMGWEEPAEDPDLGKRRLHLVEVHAKRLQAAGMIHIANGHDYVILDHKFKSAMTEADVFGLLSKCSEFEQIQLRESEGKELKRLQDIVPCDVEGDGVNTKDAKVNILLQSFISRLQIEDFALISDMAFVAQNGGRICRALLELALSAKWANVAAVLIGLCKAFEKQMWPYEHPLRQFDLKADILYNLERYDKEERYPTELALMSAAELGELVRLNERHGEALLNAAKQFPSLQMSCLVRPISSDVLRLVVAVTRSFEWTPRLHNPIEPFWLWVEDSSGTHILQSTYLTFRENTRAQRVNFIIPAPESTVDSFVTLRIFSDRWLSSEDESSVDLSCIHLPTESQVYTPRLNLPFLTPSIIEEKLSKTMVSRNIREFNAIQTQVFWSLMHTQMNALVAGPSTCGKSFMGNLLITTLMHSAPKSWVLLVSPKKSTTADSISGLYSIAKAADINVEQPQGHALFEAPKSKVIRVALATAVLENVMAVIHEISHPPTLVLCEDLDQLDSSYELAVSLLRNCLRSSPTRFVGFSRSLSDPSDVAAWLGVDPLGLHSFRANDREQELKTTTHTSSIPYSGALFKTMVKPVFAAIQGSTPAIVFVPSKGHCRSSAQDLIAQCTINLFVETAFLPDSVSPHFLEDHLARLRDGSLVDFVSRGVGIIHSGILKNDRRIMLELYAEGIVRVLVVHHEWCWQLPVRATTVVVMGTQYIHFDDQGSERQLRDYDLVTLAQMQSKAIQQSGTGFFHLFCSAEDRDTFTRFLNVGLPLESQLLESSELRMLSGSLKHCSKQDKVDVLSHTYLARRIISNPTFYDMPRNIPDELLSRIVDKLDQ
ncbi:Sec63-domain-containing protein [Coniophora puteana RWD-64-598 SS2]|uniref:Sec63-domain-containing protein n=1 Tax=Coniophora puteana (strain RWD-64-598) TaxID=741705 RepID=A0A5M3MUL9_CONPW|nr:Sec63-domain-containing protein [Coniophora puteana RWD-64-598 SS2]EIW82415.1 Sec63-domain-containing protein [Coniophora puteana RWD-64-598 SS2]